MRRYLPLFMIVAAMPRAHAQDTQRASGAQAPSLEEVIVTARKREESLQETPISVAAFPANVLEQRQATTIADIGRMTPNLSLESTSNNGGMSNSTNIFIRGVGQTDFTLTVDPGVGIYLDGVYISRAVGSLLDTADIKRVEVLRGPQGTLFGKNTIGGALVVTSAPPSEQLEGMLELTGGDFDRADVRGMISGPLTDDLAMRAAVSYQSRDGYVKRLADGQTMGDKNTLAGRWVAQYRPENWVFTLALDATRGREEGAPVVLLRANESSMFAGFHNFVLNAASCAPPPSPAVPACYNGQWVTGDPYSTWATGVNYSDLDLWGAAFTAERSGAIDIKSITAYRDLESVYGYDNDASPLRVGEAAGSRYQQHQASHELQFSGDALDDRLKYILGLFYLKEEGTFRNLLSFSIADFISGGAIDNDSYAAFSQLTYALTDRLNVTLGGRYTHEKKRFTPNQFILADRTGGSMRALSCRNIPIDNPDCVLVLPTAEVATTAKEFTPALTFDFQLAPDVLTYVNYSKGFKSGGFTQRVFPPLPQAPSFAPEFVESYEVGLKSELFERRLRLNLAAFYSDYSGIQLLVNRGIAPTVQNAGEARIQGFEVEYEAAVTERFSLSGGVGYTDAEYRSVSAGAATARGPNNPGVQLHNELPNAAQWTATAGFSFDLLDTDRGRLSLRSDWFYKSDRYLDAINSPDMYQDAYDLLSASLTFVTADERWSIGGGATNLTNSTYLLSGYQDLDAIGGATGTFARPREWFARVRMKL